MLRGMRNSLFLTALLACTLGPVARAAGVELQKLVERSMILSKVLCSVVRYRI
jgi:hypothetical protein